jgi:hypothetical protein
MPDPSVDRRLFFRWLARKGAFKVDEIRGVPQRLLDDIPALPDAELASIVPGIVGGVAISPRGAEVWAVTRGGQPTAVKLFGDDPVALSLFNQFNGQTALGDAALRLGEIMNWPAERSFAVARAFFLRLVRLGVCAPVNLPPRVPANERDEGADDEPQA